MNIQEFHGNIHGGFNVNNGDESREVMGISHMIRPWDDTGSLIGFNLMEIMIVWNFGIWLTNYSWLVV